MNAKIDDMKAPIPIPVPIQSQPHLPSTQDHPNHPGTTILSLSGGSLDRSLRPHTSTSPQHLNGFLSLGHLLKFAGVKDDLDVAGGALVGVDTTVGTESTTAGFLGVEKGSDG